MIRSSGSKQSLEKGTIMSTNLKSLSTIIGQMEQLNQIGTTLSDLGYCVPKNSRPIQLKPPKVLKNAVKESTMCLLLAIKQNKVDEYVATESKALQYLNLLRGTLLHCQQLMLPADPKYIGTAIEMCASTFGCDVPNELGLKMYGQILAKYPQCIIEEYTLELIKTYKYRRLPVPADFLAIYEPPYEHGMLFIENTYLKTKRFANIVQECYKIDMKGV